MMANVGGVMQPVVVMPQVGMQGIQACRACRENLVSGDDDGGAPRGGTRGRPTFDPGGVGHFAARRLAGAFR